MRRFGAGRPPRNYYTNSNVISNVSRELFITARQGRGRPRKYPITPMQTHPPRSAILSILAQGSTGPPVMASASPG
ncbi:MAG TPA: hypothetical protein VKM55_10155 [Candidatus Lokiarchaeia archaeon]|nr:hypothetical protein [Candidatus Lokiarchaeia archaeon]